MSQVPPTATSSTNFETIFTAAFEVYKKRTQKDITSHPLVAQLQSCDSPSAIIAVLHIQVQTFDQSQRANEKWTKWLDPTVNVLFAFSATLGNGGVGPVFPPANAIFAGIGVLLQAINGVRAGQDPLADLFSRMEFFFNRLQKYIDVQPSAAMTDLIVEILVEVISILGIVTKEVRQGRTKRYLKKLFGRDDVENALQRLDKLTQEKARMAAVEALTITRTIASQVINLNRNKLRKNCRKWIAPPDPSVNFKTASRAHHEGTASWCTKGSTFADWKTSGSLLWIHGKPGSGKSILSSEIIRDIKSLADSGLACMAYFFFDFKDTGKQDSRALLSSLLIQLSDRSEQCCDVLVGLHSAHQNGSYQPTDDSLAQCLDDMLTIIEPVPIYLIIDALDECPDDLGIPSSREKVLKLVKGLVQSHHPNLRLCITSRPEFDIRTRLEPLATQQLSLHDESGQKQDINDYVTSVVSSDERMKRWREDDKNMVIEKLTEKSNGMFRWVFCQLEVLRHCFPASLRRTLEGLPKSLDETYMRILKEIDNANRGHAMRLLQCLTVARRPLQVEELADVLAVDFNTGGVPRLNADWRWEDRVMAILSTCSSLVSVISNFATRVVQFSHFSVKEFLMSHRLASCLEEVSQFHISTEPSHATLAHACLGVLLRLDDYSDVMRVRNMPLFLYADKHWVGHAQFGNVQLRIKDAMEYFFDNDKPHFSAWGRIRRQYNNFAFHTIMGGRMVLLSQSPLHRAAEWGFRDLVEQLIFKHAAQANHLGREYCTPLHMSVRGGHIEVARFLFAHGADINSRTIDDLTPLHIASEKGHLEIVNWLLSHGADVNFWQKDGRTPLHLAARNGHLDIARILLDHNAEVNTWDSDGVTPFLAAMGNRNPDFAWLLLGHRADVHVHDNLRITPLHKAATFGHFKIARILLELNAEVNSKDYTRSTPLHRAAQSYPGEFPEIVQLLLDHHADVSMHDEDGNTPLHCAAFRGHFRVVQILLRHNAEVNSLNNGGSTPLHQASEGVLMDGGDPDIVRLLLDYGADVQVRNRSGHIASGVARGTRRQEILKLLSQHAAE